MARTRHVCLPPVPMRQAKALTCPVAPAPGLAREEHPLGNCISLHNALWISLRLSVASTSLRNNLGQTAVGHGPDIRTLPRIRKSGGHPTPCCHCARCRPPSLYLGITQSGPSLPRTIHHYRVNAIPAYVQKLTTPLPQDFRKSAN